MTVMGPPGTVSPPAAARPHPSTRGYWLGALLTAAAVIGAIIWVAVAFFEYQQQIDRYPRMTVPGVAAVQVTDTSTRVVYYENSRGTATPTLSQLGLSVAGPADTFVAVTPYTGDLRYDVPGDNGRVGRAVAEFHPSQAGMYQVKSAPTTGTTGTLAVGGDIVWDIAPHAIGAGMLFLLGGGTGVTILIITAVRRSSTRR